MIDIPATYLLQQSRSKLSDLNIQKLTISANLNKRLKLLLTEWIEARAEALFLEWLEAHGEELVVLAVEPPSEEPAHEEKPALAPLPDAAWNKWRRARTRRG